MFSDAGWMSSTQVLGAKVKVHQKGLFSLFPHSFSPFIFPIRFLHLFSTRPHLFFLLHFSHSFHPPVFFICFPHSFYPLVFFICFSSFIFFTCFPHLLSPTHFPHSFFPTRLFPHNSGLTSLLYSHISKHCPLLCKLDEFPCH